MKIRLFYNSVNTEYTHSMSTSFLHYPLTTDIYTLSLHDALPIYWSNSERCFRVGFRKRVGGQIDREAPHERILHDQSVRRHEIGEHTSELQSRQYLVCRLLLEKKNNIIYSL